MVTCVMFVTSVCSLFSRNTAAYLGGHILSSFPTGNLCVRCPALKELISAIPSASAIGVTSALMEPVSGGLTMQIFVHRMNKYVRIGFIANTLGWFIIVFYAPGMTAWNRMVDSYVAHDLSSPIFSVSSCSSVFWAF